ncbi:MAG: chemotaxis protein CheC [Bacillota bacterium]|nr:chemotaxis protein CheC [Bacillota bacterium]MDK2881715.1 chemotaxis protein CheC [Bacillota bacterium]MDK2959834.1 chemotaxis protein CheC [Bacillota bacterium]
MTEGLSEFHYDVLREVGNIGAGNAATALAQLVGRPIHMEVPDVLWVPLDEVAARLGGPEKPVAGILLGVEGEAPATILFALPLSQAYTLLDIMLGRSPGTTSALDELEQSALQETGNILTGAYLNSLNAFTNLGFRPTVPALAVDMAGAVLDYVLAEFGQVADQVLLIETEFRAEGQEVTGYFFLVPEPPSLNAIFRALGVG